MKQVTQIGTSACGATSAINALVISKVLIKYIKIYFIIIKIIIKFIKN